MWRVTSIGASALVLAACATPSQPPDFAAKNRSLDERCLQMQFQQQRSTSRPGATRAEVQGEAVAAQRRGELDKACGV